MPKSLKTLVKKGASSSLFSLRIIRIMLILGKMNNYDPLKLKNYIYFSIFFCQLKKV